MNGQTDRHAQCGLAWEGPHNNGLMRAAESVQRLRCRRAWRACWCLVETRRQEVDFWPAELSVVTDWAVIHPVRRCLSVDQQHWSTADESCHSVPHARVHRPSHTRRSCVLSVIQPLHPTPTFFPSTLWVWFHFSICEWLRARMCSQIKSYARILRKCSWFSARQTRLTKLSKVIRITFPIPVKEYNGFSRLLFKNLWKD